MTTSLMIRNVWTRIQTDNTQFLDRVRRIAGYQQQNWQQARKGWLKRLEAAGRDHESDWEYKRALEWEGWRFIGEECGSGCLRVPSGCTPMIITASLAYDEEVSFNSDRRPPISVDAGWEIVPEMRPRDYQDEVFRSVIDAGGRGVVKSPTGSGKTFMMAQIIAHYNTTTLIKVPRLIILDEVVSQLRDALTMDSGDIGVIGRGEYEPSLITVATNQSLYSIRKDPTRWRDLMSVHPKHGWGMLIEDECHGGAAKTSYEVSMSIDAYHRIGFSATPLDRQDGENIKIIGAYGEMIHEVSMERLVDDGFLIMPTVKFLPSRPVPTARNDMWPQVYNMAIVFNTERNRRIVNLIGGLNSEGRSTLVFVSRIDHGDELLRLCSAQMIDADFVHGTHPEREEIIAMFRGGDLPTMIATEGIIGEGFNFKGLDAIIIADGGKSFIKAIQKPGRGTRINEGKEDLIVYDFGDRGKYVGDHARERKTVWMDSGFDVDITETPYLR